MAGRLHTYVALLRGINVGGKNPISMRDLADWFRGLGYEDVKTYINSGNVVFRASTTDARKLERAIEAELERRLPSGVRVLVRTLAEMKKVVEGLPQAWATGGDDRQNVIFLSGKIDDRKLLDNFDPKPELEEVEYAPGVLYWSARRKTLTRTNMLKLNRSPLFQEMTIRNPNTTRKIYELMLTADKGGT